MADIFKPFVGRWKMEGPPENGKAMLKAMGMDEEKVKGMEANAELEISIKGDEITETVKINNAGGKPCSYTFKVGDDYMDRNTPMGTVKVKYNVEDGKLVKSGVIDKGTVKAVIELVDGKMRETLTLQSSDPVTAVKTFVRI